jgi:hypothetical protein
MTYVIFISWVKFLSKKISTKIIWTLVAIVILTASIGVGVLWRLSTGTLSSSATDGVESLVPLEMIVSGGPPKDGIPSIDNPRFVSAAEADAFLSEDEIVFGLFLDGVARAYPTQILVWHEIVNDYVNDRPVLITYCPLCFTGAAFERSINGEAVEFGTSGKLYNSDLVIYDRKTDSYWSQILGAAIVGELTGYELTRIPLDHITWRKWKKLHPGTEVLSRETGFNRAYSVDPYSSYYTSPNIVFPVENRDDRLPPKAVTYGVEINGKFKAYLIEDIASLVVINDHIGGEDILILGRQDGPFRSFYRNVDDDTLEFEVIGTRIFDKQTGSEWNINGEAISGPLKNKQLEQVVGTVNFWFAWVAFYPETDLYSIEG